MTVTHATVTPEDDGIRLDRWFKRHHPDLSHGMLEKWLRTGQIRVEGKRAKSNQRLEAGQEIRLPPLVADVAAAPKPTPSAAPKVDDAWAKTLTDAILHIDDQVIVLNKPPGLAVQGGTGMADHHLDAMLDVLTFDAPDRPRLVHRLDKDTSGVLVLGRSASATAKLAAAFRSREARKCYWAVTVGVPKLLQGRIDAPLAKMAGRHGDKVEVDEDDGKRAVTWYRTIEHLTRKCAWLELEPRTGRTHQLRAHCALMNTPIQGDGKYGGKDAYLEGVGISRKLHLHARAIRMPHPAGGQLMVVAPLPPHMAQTFTFLGFEERAAGKPFVAFEED